MQFLSPTTTNYAFKKIFGSPESEDVLLSFLNVVLGLQPQHRIAKVAIQDSHLPPRIRGMQDSFVNVRATDEQGKHYTIEMQVLPVQNFEQRVLDKVCKKYAEPIKKGENSRLLNDVIALTVTDFVMFEHEELISKYKLRDESGNEYSDDLELIFVELPKFTKSETELANLLDKWCYFLRHAQNLAQVPAVLAQEPPIGHAFEIANRASLSEEELALQERREMYTQDQRGALELAVEIGEARGEARGKAQGLEQGAQKKAIAIAQNMKAMGMADAQIAQLTGLGLDQVGRL